MRTSTMTRNRYTSLGLRRYAPYLLLLALAALSVSGLFSAYGYVTSSLGTLQTIAVSTTHGSYNEQAEAWWSLDANHLQELQAEWPASIPTLLGEIGLLTLEKKQILASEAIHTAAGFDIIPAHAAGRLHLLSVAIDSRLEALTARWNRTDGYTRLLSFRGYPIDRADAAEVVEPGDVEQILTDLDLPASILEGYRVTLLPFALEKTAGLGASGESIVGAAPSGTRVSPNRTAYTLLHELGHHIHFTYMDNVSGGEALWRRYMELRGIEEWSESGVVESEAWARSPQETFAEDFRMLFGGQDARSFPHATAYGDPSQSPDGGASLRSFMQSLVSR